MPLISYEVIQRQADRQTAAAAGHKGKVSERLFHNSPNLMENSDCLFEES